MTPELTMVWLKSILAFLHNKHTTHLSLLRIKIYFKPLADFMELRNSDIKYSDWLKIVMCLGTSDHRSFFQSSLATLL